MIFGTLVEAGAALIHGFNERIADMAREKQARLPRGWRAWLHSRSCVCPWCSPTRWGSSISSPRDMAIVLTYFSD